MPVGITDLAHSLRKHAGPQQPPLPLGHWHQLVCAALGHKSLASFQAAQVAEREPPQFDHVSYVVADLDLLAQRANEFSLSLTKDHLRTLVKAAFGERLPRMKVTHSYADLAAEFQEAAQLAVLSADEVNSAIAGANHDGIKEIYFEPNGYEMPDSDEYHILEDGFGKDRATEICIERIQKKLMAKLSPQS